MTNSSRRRATTVLAVVLAASTGFAQTQRRPAAPPNFDAFYELGPDSLIRRGVPKGTVKGPVRLPSQVYPGVAHPNDTNERSVRAGKAAEPAAAPPSK